MIDFIIEHKEFFILFVGIFLIMMLWKAGLQVLFESVSARITFGKIWTIL